VHLRAHGARRLKMPPLKTIIGWRIYLTGGGRYSEILRTMTMKTGNVIYQIIPFRTIHDILRFIIPFKRLQRLHVNAHYAMSLSRTTKSYHLKEHPSQIGPEPARTAHSQHPRLQDVRQEIMDSSPLRNRLASIPPVPLLYSPNSTYRFTYI
jgi:hypothetical protein